MALTIQAGALRRAATLAGSVVERRNTVPILGNLLLATDDGHLTVTGTNLDQRLSVACDAEGDMPARTVGARALQAVLAKLPAEAALTLASPKPEALTISGAGLEAELNTLPAEDFPDPIGFKEPKAATVPAALLHRLLSAPAYAISTEETRYYLNGIYLHAQDGALWAAATDGHRLHACQEPMPEGWELPAGIVPRDALKSLLPLLAKQPLLAKLDGDVDVEGDGARLAVVAEDWCFVTKLIDGNFPDWRRVLPKPDAGCPITVASPRAFMAAVDLATGHSGERSRPAKLGNGSGAALLVEGYSPETGRVTVTVDPDVAAWAGEQHPEAGFQARYLRDVCRALPGGFTMRVHPASGPCLIEAGADLACLMPMRV